MNNSDCNPEHIYSSGDPSVQTTLSEEAAWFNGGLMNSTLPTLEPGDTFFVPNKGCKFRCTQQCEFFSERLCESRLLTPGSFRPQV